MTDARLEALSRVHEEAKRALEGMADGRIPRGTQALTNVLHLSGDALHDAHKNGQLNKEEAAA